MTTFNGGALVVPSGLPGCRLGTPQAVAIQGAAPAWCLTSLVARWLNSYMASGKDETEAAAVFKALADSTRRHVLEDLSKGDLAAGELASRFPISGPSVSRHLAVLKAAGLVSERRSGNRVIYSLASDRLATHVGDFLATVCPGGPGPTPGQKKDQDNPEKPEPRKAQSPRRGHGATTPDRCARPPRRHGAGAGAGYRQGLSGGHSCSPTLGERPVTHANKSFVVPTISTPSPLPATQCWPASPAGEHHRHPGRQARWKVDHGAVHLLQDPSEGPVRGLVAIIEVDVVDLEARSRATTRPGPMRTSPLGCTAMASHIPSGA